MGEKNKVANVEFAYRSGIDAPERGCLSWEMNGARFHVWELPQNGKNEPFEETVYKNPPYGVHKYVRDENGKHNYEEDPRYFGTRKLTTTKGEEMVGFTQAVMILEREQLRGAAVEAWKAEKAAEKVKWRQDVRNVRKKERGDEVFDLLKAITDLQRDAMLLSAADQETIDLFNKARDLVRQIEIVEG